LIDNELKKHGFEEGDAYITFQTSEEDLDTNFLATGDDHGTEANTEQKLTNVGKSTAITTDPNPYETQKKKSEA
jgi:hypothetical protein